MDEAKLIRFPAQAVARYRELGYWGQRTIGDEFRKQARRHPQREALVTLERRLTYAELDAASDRVAARLAALGLRQGDAIMLQVGNTAETIEALYGMLKLGAIPVCSLVPFGHHEIDAIARIVAARAHLVQADIPNADLVQFSREVREAVPSVEFTLTIRGDTADAHRIDAGPAGEIPPGPSDPDSVAVFQLSGGTTGTPKVIPRGHAEYWYYGRATAERFGYTADERLAQFLPIVHNSGMHAGLFAGHSAGATVVLGPTWKADIVVEMLERERVTMLATLTSLMQAAADDRHLVAAIAKLKRVGLAVPAVPPELFDKLTAAGVQVVQFFGMSEGFACSMPTDAPLEMRRETVGYPISPADEFKVVDPESGLPRPDGETGELCVRGPYTLHGYYDAAEHNARAFTPDGFLRTGDLVSVLEVGGQRCLRIEGRHKDLVSRGGEKINASEIEELLLTLPGVRDAALVAAPDARLGERPLAFLVTERAAVSLDDVRRLMSARGVARYKWPEFVELIDELPRTPIGKVNKVALRAEARQRLASDAPAGRKEA